MIEFYTNKNKYFVTDKFVFQGGELIAKGKIFIQNLLLDENAFLIVKNDNYIEYLQLDKVISILPEDEYFDGERNPKRKTFQVAFEVIFQNDYIRCNREVLAVNEFHVKQLLKGNFGKKVRSVFATEKAVMVS